MVRYDVIVVGGGAMGTAAARNLAMRGRSTLLLERFTFGHDKGSSGGPTRIFRYAYHTPGYARMAMQARPAWDELQSAGGEELLRVTGGLDVGPAALPRAAILEAAGAAVERWSAGRVAERWPSLQLPEVADIVFQPDGGVIRASRTVQVQARLAAEAGADVREQTTARSIEPSNDGARVRTDRDEAFEGDVVVVAAGPWAAPLLGPAGFNLALRPNLEQATYFRLDPDRTLPTVIDWFADEAHPPYLVPDPFEAGHFKVGLHMAGPPTDAETRTFDADPVRVAKVRDYVAAHVAEATDLDRTDTCLYTIAPDEDFVLDRVGPLVIASPCSGHGFKFVPLFGQAIADLATGAPTPFPVEPFRADRAAIQASS
jgi:sarcosine oxidase